MLSSRIIVSFPSGHFTFCLLTKNLNACLYVPMRATFPVDPIVLDLITLIIFGEENKLRSSTLCYYLHSPIISFLFVPHIILSTPFSNIFVFFS
jgi:hypothetical protein